MTTRQVQALADRFNLQRQAEDYRAFGTGRTVAALMKGKPVHAGEIFPSLRVPRRKQTAEEQIGILEAFAQRQNAIHG